MGADSSILRVFVSSTSEDLKVHRAVARQVIGNLRWHAVMMEDFGASASPTVTACLEELAQCQLMVLVVAFRKGWTPSNEQGGNGQDSITALELGFARSKRIPVLALLASDDSWPLKLCDDDAGLKWIKEFRANLNLPAEFFGYEDPGGGEEKRLPSFRDQVRKTLLSHQERRLAELATAAAQPAHGLDYYPSARDSILEGSCVPFVGAGVFEDGPLSVRALAGALAGGQEMDGSCLATVAEYRERFLGSRERFLNELHEVVATQSREARLPQTLEMIVRMERRPPLLVATTHDQLIEDALAAAARRFVVVTHVITSADAENDGRILVLRRDAPPVFCHADKVELDPDELIVSREYGTPDQWPAADAGWFAAQVFEQYDPLHDADAVLAEGTRFMKAAVRRLPDEKATELFYGLEKTCLEPGPNNWCWPLLAEVADVRPDVWTSLDLALILADRESVEEMHAASSRLERARSLLRGAKGLSLEQRQLFDFWATFVEAKVHYALFVMTGNARDLEEARRLIPAMFTNPAIKAREGPEVAAIWLGTRIFNDGEKPEPEAARALRTSASPTAQTDTGFLSNALFDGLRAGDVESVRKIASQAQAKTRDTTAEQSSDPLFVASIGGLLTDPERTEWTARKFMGTGHVYAPVVSMLLIARTQGPARDGAKQLMEERWARIDPATWDKRLVLGDRTAWYEMLLGYFAGRVPAGTIFDPLQDDQAFAASKFAGLHVTRRALLTEARFYDAVRLMAAGDSNRAMASLHQAIDLGYKRYIEYDMAVHLLRLASGSK